MNKKYLRSLLWITKLQLQTSPFSYTWGILNSLVSGILPLVQAFALAKLISSVSQTALRQASPTQVYFWLVVLLIVEITNQITSTFDRVIANRFEQKLNVVMTERFFTMMYRLSQEQFDNEAFNTKLERARNSLSRLWRLNNELFSAISSFISFSGAVIAILVVAPLVGVIIVVVSIPITLIQIRQNKLREKVYNRAEPYERVAYRSRWMLINSQYMPEVRLMNAVKRLTKSWRTNQEKADDLFYKNDLNMAKSDNATGVVQPLINFGANIYFFRLLLAGTLGLDRFIFLRGILEQASNGASQIITRLQNLHEIFLDLSIFDEVYNTKPTIPNGNIKVTRPLTIEFRNVSFSYPNTSELVLDDVSFVITPGTKLAIVGENGAGKTTLIKLLLRQYLPSKGTVLINGTDIADVDQESYYSAISNLSQEFLILHHLSVKENLVMGIESEPSEDEIYKTTDLVDATKFIQKLPQKLETRLDPSFENGTNLSGGQNQRISVARALLRNGDLLILDEPTSAIDAKAEFSIFKNIYQAHAGKTTLIVSHRFSTVRQADTIMVMDKGKIIEYGTHSELLQHAGLYKEMFEIQAEGYK